jgi:hypothetical protein
VAKVHYFLQRAKIKTTKIMMDMPIGLMIFTENLFHFLVCPTRGTGFLIEF